MYRAKELFRRWKVSRALLGGAEHPETLPNPDLRPMGAADRARIDGLESVALLLGPYRNLTTLTAAILFLHPHCQVLNHAGPRILPDESINFLGDYSDEKFRQFCHYAITMSQGGARGGYGGSVVLAHAYADHEKMMQTYLQRYGGRLLKSEIKSLVWKESQRVNQFIHDHKVDVNALLDQNEKLRFLMPIRRPLDTAASILRIGMQKIYGLPESCDLFDVLEPVLGELAWFIDFAAQRPERFFYFYQDELNAQVLEEIEGFLGLPHDARWVADSLSVYELRPTKAYDAPTLERYSDLIERHFGGHPDVQQRLLAMAAPTGH